MKKQIFPTLIQFALLEIIINNLIQNHMNALAAYAASAWYLTLNMTVIFLAIFIEPLANWEYGQAVHGQNNS